MKKIFGIILVVALIFCTLIIFQHTKPFEIISGAPPYYIDDKPTPDNIPDEYAWTRDWERPPGPPRVGLQVGHYKNDEVPEELHRLRGNTGAEGGGTTEVEVNLTISELTKEILESQGVIVDILPATIPPNYWADVFVSVHADGSLDYFKSGYKGAVPRRDFTGNANDLLTHVEKSYEESTGLIYDPEVTRNMRGYYAFSFWRFDHALHPMTTAMILETGFLTNASDREIIVNNPNLSAAGLARGITNYLKSKNLL